MSHTKQKIDQILDGYLEAALFTGTDESDDSGGAPLDKNYSISDFNAADVRKVRGKIAAWVRKNKSAIAGYVKHRKHNRNEGTVYHYLGHDLWLTANGHGTGFWDRDYGGHDEIGERLTKAAKAFGEKWTTVGDNGEIYIS